MKSNDTCPSGKECHITASKAWNQVEKRGGGGRKVYKCNECHHYHITSAGGTYEDVKPIPRRKKNHQRRATRQRAQTLWS